GSGGAAGVNPACPNSNGTAGGQGGHFNAVTFTLSSIGLSLNVLRPSATPTGYSGTSAASTPAVTGGAGATFDYAKQYGADGAIGGIGTDPVFAGADGHAATSNVDVSLLVAGSGSDGEIGMDGAGGTGG